MMKRSIILILMVLAALSCSHKPILENILKPGECYTLGEVRETIASFGIECTAPCDKIKAAYPGFTTCATQSEVPLHDALEVFSTEQHQCQSAEAWIALLKSIDAECEMPEGHSRSKCDSKGKGGKCSKCGKTPGSKGSCSGSRIGKGGKGGQGGKCSAGSKFLQSLARKVQAAQQKLATLQKQLSQLSPELQKKMQGLMQQAQEYAKMLQDPQFSASGMALEEMSRRLDQLARQLEQLSEELKKAGHQKVSEAASSAAKGMRDAATSAGMQAAAMRKQAQVQAQASGKCKGGKSGKPGKSGDAQSKSGSAAEIPADAQGGAESSMQGGSDTQGKKGPGTQQRPPQISKKPKREQQYAPRADAGGFAVGQTVRIKSLSALKKLDREPYLTDSMFRHAGKTARVTSISPQGWLRLSVSGRRNWHHVWIEGGGQ